MIALTQVLLGASDANLKAIENGRRDLARQRAAAHREGIALSPWHPERPLPPPEQNAALVYEQLTHLLKEKPFDEPLLTAALRVSSRHAYGASDVAAARRLVSERRDVLMLVRQATDRHSCAFPRQWSLGNAITYPEIGPARDAARLLTMESILLALDGRYKEAITNQCRGFRIAAQIASNGVLIHYVGAIACETITLFGLEEILRQAGPNAAAAEQVRAAIAANRPSFSLRRTLEGDLLQDMAAMDEFRALGFQTVYVLSSQDASTAEAQAAIEFWERTPRLQEAWLSWVDAAEADSPRPPAPRVRDHRAASPDPRASRPPMGCGAQVPLGRYGVPVRTVLLPQLTGAISKEAAVRARERVLMGAAAVLAYRSRQGRWPDRLEEADPRLPPDLLTGRSLQYRREGDGFVIYSAGEDGRYDGGRPGVPLDTRQVVFRYPAPPPRSDSAGGSPPAAALRD